MVTKKKDKARKLVLAIFAIFLLVNAIVLTVTMIAFLNDDASALPWNLGEDAALGLRLIIFVIGAGLSWFLAQMLYRQLVTSVVSPGDASGTAASLMSYLMLVFAAFAFLGAGVWLWLPLLFVVVLLWSTVSIWSLVGATTTAATVALAIVAVVATWYLVS